MFLDTCSRYAPPNITQKLRFHSRIPTEKMFCSNSYLNRERKTPFGLWNFEAKDCYHKIRKKSFKGVFMYLLPFFCITPFIFNSVDGKDIKKEMEN